MLADTFVTINLELFNKKFIYEQNYTATTFCLQMLRSDFYCNALTAYDFVWANNSKC